MEEKKSVPVFYDDISRLIASYVPKKELLPWIDPEKLDYEHISKNPNAIEFLKANPKYIDWLNIISNPSVPIEMLEVAIKKIPKRFMDPLKVYLSKNPKAVDFLEKHPELIFWETLSMNPNAKKLFEKYFPKHIVFKRDNKKNFAQNVSENPSLVDWVTTEGKEYFDKKAFSRNPAAVKYLKAHPELISKKAFSRNPEAVKYLKAHPELISKKAFFTNPAVLLKDWETIESFPEYENIIDWYILSEIPEAVPLLKKNKDKIDWFAISGNPAAGELIEEKLSQNRNLDEFDISALMKNPALVDFFRKNPNLIMWEYFSQNPGIFKDVIDPVVFKQLQNVRRRK